MKDKVFHFFGNIIEQSPIPTPIKVAIEYRLNVLIFFLTQFSYRVVRKPGEKRISENFMKYIYKMRIDKNSKQVEILKKGMDSQSKNLIDAIIKRQEHMYTHNVFDTRLLSRSEQTDQYIDIYHIKKKYYGLANYYGIENFYFHCGLRFVPKQVLMRYQKGAVIDAGASNGDTPAIFRKEYSFGTIYAFEPENNNYRRLLQTIKRFQLKDIVPVNKGVGDRSRKVKITNEEGQSNVSEGGTQWTDIITIDEFAEKNNVSVGLIKMDVEGFESYAIVGAERTIKKYHPILLISIYHNGKDFFEIKPLLEKWGKYKFMVRKLNPHHFFFDTMLIGVPI